MLPQVESNRKLIPLPQYAWARQWRLIRRRKYINRRCAARDDVYRQVSQIFTCEQMKNLPLPIPVTTKINGARGPE